MRGYFIVVGRMRCYCIRKLKGDIITGLLLNATILFFGNKIIIKNVFNMLRIIKRADNESVFYTMMGLVFYPQATITLFDGGCRIYTRSVY